MKSNLYFGDAKLHETSNDVLFETVSHDGDTYFKIENYNEMDPFFMTIVSDVDFWMFVSSTGGITAGRQKPANSLFPYYTDDKIHDSCETSGAHSVFIISKDNKRFLWKPFSMHHKDVYQVKRNLYKNTLGNRIMFEEINFDLGVAFRYTWKTSNRFGIVKHSELIGLSEENVQVEILDGIRNIMPYGVDMILQNERSTLVDGYKRCELIEKSGLGIFNLSSIISDRAEPSESLKATSVWSKGLDEPKYLLSELQVNQFISGHSVSTESDIKGRRGAFYVSSSLTLEGQTPKEWYIVSELKQSAADIQKLIHDLSSVDIISELEEDIRKGDSALTELVFNADGLQLTNNEKTGFRHFSNTLFNIMRGGIYSNGYDIDLVDLKSFVMKWNLSVYETHEAFFTSLGERVHYSTLLEKVKELKSADLERLVLEYLPLTYSRRHGDPSRPWNKFSIDIFKEDGERNLNFEGNWRDIFQNWEALSLSYPLYTEGIISKFLNASTADGYNPYRITKDGIDWEMLDPEDPWSNIGYWGDHQIIYLLKLMELSKKFNPEKMKTLLNKEIFAYANVPYRIKGFEDLIKDTRNTIWFDDDLEELIQKRVKENGYDGKLIHKDGSVYKVNLVEKLMVTMLSKLSNYVPEGGIWMNTQRPEWNDANNALVGNGISMVTLYYLYRYQNFMKELIEEMDDQIVVSEEVYKMFNETHKVFSDYDNLINKPISDELRFNFVKDLGLIGESYRNSIYGGFTGNKVSLSKALLNDFVDTTLRHLKDTIVKNKREDGLYHAYNLLNFKNDTCELSYLNEMLEGQVSVLSSKALGKEETLDILDSLRKSSIYREDQNSYMLYPNKALPLFLDKNIVPESMVMSSKILKKEVELKKTRFIEKDINGVYHFNGLFRNGDEIMEAITACGEYEEDEIKLVGELFSELFDHHSFTGRSGTFYKYEGLGCIYWHMVSKLVLASQESFNDVYDVLGKTDDTLKLHGYYHELKDGIGVEKSPVEYGAFPTDAYSHTPGFAGVQQPGMTGQVKEDFLSRFGELGVLVKEGEVIFEPKLLSKDEFLEEPTVWKLPNRDIELLEGQLGFTFNTVPVIYTLASEKSITVHYQNGDTYRFENISQLDKKMSASIFNRDEKIIKVDVNVNSYDLI